MVKLLQEYGADINMRGPQGTLLEGAAKLNSPEVPHLPFLFVRLLLEHGAGNFAHRQPIEETSVPRWVWAQGAPRFDDSATWVDW